MIWYWDEIDELPSDSFYWQSTFCYYRYYAKPGFVYFWNIDDATVPAEQPLRDIACHLQGSIADASSTVWIDNDWHIFGRAKHRSQDMNAGQAWASQGQIKWTDALQCTSNWHVSALFQGPLRSRSRHLAGDSRCLKEGETALGLRNWNQSIHQCISASLHQCINQPINLSINYSTN